MPAARPREFAHLRRRRQLLPAQTQAVAQKSHSPGDAPRLTVAARATPLGKGFVALSARPDALCD